MQAKESPIEEEQKCKTAPEPQGEATQTKTCWDLFQEQEQRKEVKFKIDIFLSLGNLSTIKNEIRREKRKVKIDTNCSLYNKPTNSEQVDLFAGANHPQNEQFAFVVIVFFYTFLPSLKTVTGQRAA